MRCFPLADVRAGHPLPPRSYYQVVVPLGLVDPEEHVPPYRLAALLYGHQGALELSPLPGGTSKSYPSLAFGQAFIVTALGRWGSSNLTCSLLPAPTVSGSGKAYSPKLS